MAHRYTGRGIDLDDLQQVAGLALVLAANRYDPHRGRPFTAYAVITISGELKRHLRDHGWGVRPPRTVHDTYLQVGQATADLTQSQHNSPTVHDISQSLGITPEQVCEAQKAGLSYAAASLDALLNDHGDPPVDRDHDDELPNPADRVLTRVALQQSFRLLTPRDRLMLHLRFDEDLSQRQIGDRLGISQMQVSRVLTSIFARLRVSLTVDARDLDDVPLTRGAGADPAHSGPIPFDHNPTTAGGTQ